MQYRDFIFSIVRRKSGLICLLLLFFSAQAFAARSIVGFEFGGSTVEFQDRYGKDFLYDNELTLSIVPYGTYGESIVDREIMLQMSISPTDTDRVTIYQGEFYPGTSVPVPADAWMSWDTSYTMTSLAFLFDKYLSVGGSEHLDIYLAAGAGLSRLKAEINLYNDSYNSGYQLDEVERAKYRNTFDKYSLVPIFRIGIMFNPMKIFSLRICYQLTCNSVFGTLKSQQHPNAAAAIKLTNSGSLFVGLLLRL